MNFEATDFKDGIGETVMNIFGKMVIFNSAIKEVSTKLEILNDEFQAKKKRNPIEHIESRVKTPKSIINKLQKKDLPITFEAAFENLNDIAGIRVICSFVDDIYWIANLLKSQDDITVIEEKDYIKNPKPSGYRSLHLVLEIPVFFSEQTMPVRIEIQIRTIAMDFWASLEHKIHYKIPENISDSIPESITYELKECADIIASTDIRMQNIHHMIEDITTSSKQ